MNTYHSTSRRRKVDLTDHELFARDAARIEFGESARQWRCWDAAFRDRSPAEIARRRVVAERRGAL